MEEAKEKVMLKFLTENGQTEAIQNQCIQWLQGEQTESIFRLLVTIDPTSLLQFDSQLFEMVIHTPNQGLKILKKTVFSFIIHTDWLEHLIESTQLVVGIEITYLPPFPGYFIKNLQQCPSCKEPSRFYRFDGIVVGTSSISCYTQCAKYICPAETCPSAGKVNEIRHHQPGTLEENTVRKNLVCPYCAAILIEDPTFRVLGERIVTQMVSLDAFTLQDTIFQSLTVIFRESLVNEASLGRELSLIVRPVYTYVGNVAKVTLEVNNLIKKGLELEPRHYPEPNLILGLPHIEDCPWSFSLSLAFKFAVGSLLLTTAKTQLKGSKNKIKKHFWNMFQKRSPFCRKSEHTEQAPGTVAIP